TGDAQLTISQNAPLTGAVIVTTPQAVSLADARKGMMMFQNVKVPLLGVVENMSGSVFGHGGGSRLAEEFRVPYLGSLPLDPQVVETGDAGMPLVAEHPGSPVALEFQRISGKVIEQLAAQRETGFKPLSLEWR
ncbi:Mrp/NBP35 family ATP-binding protein, partial [bacterium]|nr:Mrp/NBP35 family ATP-binding protein [bacterium]